MSDQSPLGSPPEETQARIRKIVEDAMSQQPRSEKIVIPISLSLEALEKLPYEETLSRLRHVVQFQLAAQADTPVEASPGVEVAGKATIRISARGSLSVTGSVAPRLIDPETSKKFWESPSGWEILAFITMILIFLYQEYRLDIRGDEGEKFMREIVKEVEEFFLIHASSSNQTRRLP